MSARICSVCWPKAEPFAKPLLELARKFEEAERTGVQFDEQFLASAEKLARSLDAILCAECKKLGPRLPSADEYPFGRWRG